MSATLSILPLLRHICHRFNVEPTKSECCTNSDNAAAMCQVCADDSLLTFRYEGMLRLFKWRRRRDGEDLHEKPHRHDLIHEAEAEMHTLSWPELMAAGGVAGVVAWMVSWHRMDGGWTWGIGGRNVLLLE